MAGPPVEDQFDPLLHLQRRVHLTLPERTHPTHYNRPRATSDSPKVLLFLVTTPVYVLLLVSRVNGDTLSTADTIYAGLMLGMVTTSAIADQQQWSASPPASVHPTLQPTHPYRFPRNQKGLPQDRQSPARIQS